MKINIIVQARMGSTRFPGKVLAEVDGKPLLHHLLDRIVGADVDKIIVAIPFKDADYDSPLVQAVARYGRPVLCSLGDEYNVASRFCNTLRVYPCDAFVRICADSPCPDINMVNGVADALRRGVQYVHGTAGLAGTQVQGIRTDVFLAYVDEFDAYDREHVLSYFNRKMSLVVDTPEDLERVRPAIEQNMDLSQWMNHILPA